MLAGEIEGYRLRKRYIRSDGSLLHVELEVRCVQTPDGGAPYTLATINDVTERRIAELRLTRARDLNAMLSRVNAAVAHAEDERSLLADTCRIAVESGYFGHARAACGSPTGRRRSSRWSSTRRHRRHRPPTKDGPLDDPCAISIATGNAVEWSDLTDVLPRALRARRAGARIPLAGERAAATRRHGRGVAVPVRARARLLRAGCARDA